MKSRTELKVLTICYITLMSFILIGLLSILVITTYSLVITGNIPLQDYCCLILLVIIVTLLLKLYICNLIIRIDQNDNEIVYYPLFGRTVSDEKEVIPIINSGRILVYKTYSQKTKRKKLIVILKDFYKREDLVNFCKIV